MSQLGTAPEYLASICVQKGPGLKGLEIQGPVI